MPTFKELQTDRALLESNLAETKKLAAEWQRAVSQLEAELRRVEAAIADMSRREIVVTEHAILRYLERVKLVDMEAVKRAILSETSKAHINAFNSGTFPGDGFKLRVKDRCVVTVIT